MYICIDMLNIFTLIQNLSVAVHPSHNCIHSFLVVCAIFGLSFQEGLNRREETDRIETAGGAGVVVYKIGQGGREDIFSLPISPWFPIPMYS